MYIVYTLKNRISLPILEDTFTARMLLEHTTLLERLAISCLFDYFGFQINNYTQTPFKSHLGNQCAQVLNMTCGDFPISYVHTH